MSQQDNSDDLVATKTENYVAGNIKDIGKLRNLDSQDESLNRWKESLGLNEEIKVRFPDDQRTVIVQALVMQSEGKEIVMDVSTPQAIKNLQDKPLIIKEGVEYAFKIKFVVQREMVTGLKFLQHVKRVGLPMDKLEVMCGSYGPKFEDQERVFPSNSAPSGFMARGSYTVRSKFVDDDNNVHLDWVWPMEIKKEWV
ncbi:rho GDP dissociation inhibitor [Coemansia sp. Benny D160-2]|nr:rho GDP dissociation inhibitor [Coemansia sp. Benny D160-2]